MFKRMKTHYLYSIPYVALSCVFAGCSDDQKSSEGNAKADQASAAAPSVTVETVDAGLIIKRAERLGIASLFPKEMCVVAGVYDIPGMIKGVEGLNTYKFLNKNSGLSIDIPDEEDSEDTEDTDVSPSISSPVVDVMVGMGPVWPAWANANQDAFRKMGLEQTRTYLEMVQMFSAQAKAEGGMVGLNTRLVGPMRMLAQLVSLIDLRPSSCNTAPLMVVASLTPEGLAQAQAMFKDANLPEEMQLFGLLSLYNKTYNGIDCKVLEVDCKKLRVKAEELIDSSAGQDMPVSFKESLEQIKGSLVRLDESKLYLVMGFVGDKLVSFITTNPEAQVRVAANPQDSVLSRSDFSMADKVLSYPAYGLFFLGKDAVEAGVKMDINYYGGMLEGCADILTFLGKEWKVADTAPSLAAMESIKGQVVGFYDKILKTATSASYYAWQDQGLHVELSCYPLDIFSLDAPSAMNAVRPGPDTVLYYSGRVNPALTEMSYSMVGSLSQIVWDYGHAYMADPKNKVNDQVRMMVPMLKMAQPTLEELWAASKLLNSALTGSSAVVVDMKGAANPLTKNIPIPRFSFMYEVKDRALLTEAWNKVNAASKTIVPLVSQGKMTELPAPRMSTEGDVTMYDYESPMGPDLNPVVSVSDTRWALSMPKAFGLENIKASMVAPGQVAPMEFQLNLKPLADALRAPAASDKKIKETLNVLEMINSDIKGIQATGNKAANGQEIYHLHIISAGK